MRPSPAMTVLLALAIAVVGVGCGGAVEEPAPQPDPASGADEAVQHDDPNARYYTPDGRTAAMGSFEAGDREDWQMSPQIMGALHLEPGMMVAEVGAGTGYFTRQIAGLVAPEGKVLAVDIIPEFLEELATRAEAAGIDNIEVILGDLTDPKLPQDSVDLIFLGDSYHHFGEPIPMLQHMRAALKPGGRMAIVDWERAANPSFERAGLDWESHIRLGSQGVIDEVTSHGFRLVEQPDFLEWQFYLIFERTE